MKVLQIHNKYRFRGGEEAVVEWTTELLRSKGVDVRMVTRESVGLDNNFITKFRAFASSIYSLSAYSFIEQLIRKDRPDVVHVHNLYPLFSPSVLSACRHAGIPVVMTCHNYRLLCPIGVAFRNGGICDAFCHHHEYRCVINNCRGNLLESGAYAIRSAIASRFKFFEKNVTIFIALTQIAKDYIAKGGIPKERIVVLPNSIPTNHFQSTEADRGEYIAYAGRISAEKGIGVLLQAASITGLPLRIAGDSSSAKGLISSAPPNVKFVGFLSKEKLSEFYNSASFLVLPSICHETCGLVLLEAMQASLAIIASRIGGITEIVDDGVTGLFFEPGNANDLASKMKQLCNDPELCRRMGEAGRHKALTHYDEDSYYKKLMAIYEKAISNNKKRKNSR